MNVIAGGHQLLPFVLWLIAPLLQHLKLMLEKEAYLVLLEAMSTRIQALMDGITLFLVSLLCKHLRTRNTSITTLVIYLLYNILDNPPSTTESQPVQRPLQGNPGGHQEEQLPQEAPVLCQPVLDSPGHGQAH